MTEDGEKEITLMPEAGEQELVLDNDTPTQTLTLEEENINYQYIVGAVTSVNGQTGDVILTTSDLENTSDFVSSNELASVAFSGDYDDLENEPTTFTGDEWELLWQNH